MKQRLPKKRTPTDIIARIDAIDFAAARLDVEPFVSDPSSLSIWSRDYFKAVVRQMKFSPSPSV